ncbi:hypothetical protein ACFLT8_00590 [Chloroflexota bacterium]
MVVGFYDIGKGGSRRDYSYLFGGCPRVLRSGGWTGSSSWSYLVYSLRFTAGNGLAISIGVLFVLLTRDLLIAFAITLLLTVITRNPVFSVNLNLVSVLISG